MIDQPTMRAMEDAQLYDRWIEEKRREADAKATRQAIEDELGVRFPTNTNEGTVRRNAGSHKVSVQYKLYRHIDDAAYERDVLPELSGKVIPEAYPVKYTFELSLSRFRIFCERYPELVPLLASAMEERPARPNYKIERTGESS